MSHNYISLKESTSHRQRLSKILHCELKNDAQNLTRNNCILFQKNIYKFIMIE